MYDLIIVGCGPVGAVAGNLAGAAGLSTLILDRADDIYTLPRAIHFDAHIMRIIQQIGLADEVLAETRVWKRSIFYGADGNPIRVHDWPNDRILGWDAHYLFYQPTFERVLREGFSRFPNIEFRAGCEVQELAHSDGHVTVSVRDHSIGADHAVQGRYVLGSDGASSFVRSNSDIELKDNGFDEPWLVVDLLTDKILGEPGESEMFCDPTRPSTRVPGPGRHHRWEFMLLPGESAEQMQRLENVLALLAPWVEPDDVKILRASVYRFHSLMAEKWRAGRVFLAGDAAHQTPPFLGQGMCHGIRDVQNLMWKIRAVIGGAPTEPLLGSYEEERRPHVARIIEMSVASGRDICELNPEEAARRDKRIRDEVNGGVPASTTFRGLPPLQKGILGHSSNSGNLFLQPAIAALNGREWLFDDLAGADFVVVALDEIDERVKSAAQLLNIRVVLLRRRDLVESFAARALIDVFEQQGDQYAIVRPDKYIYGMSRSADGAVEMLNEIGLVLRQS